MQVIDLRNALSVPIPRPGQPGSGLAPASLLTGPVVASAIPESALFSALSVSASALAATPGGAVPGVAMGFLLSCRDLTVASREKDFGAATLAGAKAALSIVQLGGSLGLIPKHGPVGHAIALVAGGAGEFLEACDRAYPR